ncbi:MAG: MATE family efflux transporter, partial [Erysipelotrichaceae bacterium]|nr:MATE family efflux transporter [Erysipelotrichaceae bacterium]
FCMNGYFNGCGYTKFVMIQSIVGAFCVRVPVSYFMSKVTPVSLFKIGLATPASSLLQVILCLGYMVYVKKKMKKVTV